MIRRRAVRAGVLVLASIALSIAPASSQADPCAATEGDTSRIDGSLTAPAPNLVEQANPSVRIEGSGFRYKDPSPLGFNEADVNRLEAQLLLCGDTERVLPEPSAAVSTAGGEPKSIAWDTPPLVWNGAYAVRLTAKATNGTQRVIVRPFTMDLPAQKPQNVKAAAASGSTSVTLSWDSNSEPDLIAYGIEWISEDASGWSGAKAETVAPASGSRQSFTHDPGAGTWRYRITAARRGVNRDDINVSEPSERASATVTAPTPTTTASGSGSSGGGTAVASGGATAAPSTTPTTAKPATTSVDLNRFSQLLDQRRATAPKPAPEPDPGFQETLPFQPRVDEPVVENAAENASDELGTTQEIITDDGERRRAMSFVAAGLFAFVLAMGMRVLKAEADRVPDLEPAPSEMGDGDVDADWMRDLALERDGTTTSPELRDLDLAQDVPTALALAGTADRRARRRAERAGRRTMPEPELDVALPVRDRRAERRARREQARVGGV